MRCRNWIAASCCLIEIQMSHNHAMRNFGNSGIKIWLAMMLLLSSVRIHAESKPYEVQPGDVLQISVWKETDLQAEVLVRPDGGISFPLAGDMHVEGMNITQITQALIERIQKYIPDPVVTVTTKSIGGNRVYVVGKVNRPGEYPFSRPVDVMQALSMAGGATPFASLSDIRILRRENGKQTAIKFDYNKVEEGKVLDSNIELRSGDTVVVP